MKRWILCILLSVTSGCEFGELRHLSRADQTERSWTRISRDDDSDTAAKDGSQRGAEKNKPLDRARSTLH